VVKNKKQVGFFRGLGARNFGGKKICNATCGNWATGPPESLSGGGIDKNLLQLKVVMSVFILPLIGELGLGEPLQS